MSQVGRQNGQAALHVLTGAIPLDQSLYSKSMTKIVKTRPMTIGRPTQTDLARQEVKRAPDLSAIQPSPTSRYEERCRPLREKMIPPHRIVGEHLACGWMNRNQAGLAELGASNSENTFL